MTIVPSIAAAIRTDLCILSFPRVPHYHGPRVGAERLGQLTCQPCRPCVVACEGEMPLGTARKLAGSLRLVAKPRVRMALSAAFRRGGFGSHLGQHRQGGGLRLRVGA